MEKGYYPEHAISELEKQHESLERTFTKIWTVLSPSPERDEVMLHILLAKKKINEIITNNQEENKNE
jgi:hypothetical protein